MEAVQQRVVPILVDLTARGGAPQVNLDFSNRYGVTGIPKMLLVDGSGKIVSKIDDYRPETIIALLPAPSASSSAAPPPSASGWGLLTMAAVVFGLIGVVAVIGGVMWKMGMFSSED